MMTVGVVVAVVRMTVLARIGPGDDVALEPALHEGTRLGRCHADEHRDARRGHASLSAAAHARGDEHLHAPRPQPVSPLARFRLQGANAFSREYHPGRGIDLEKAGLLRRTEVRRELVLLSQRNGNDHAVRISESAGLRARLTPRPKISGRGIGSCEHGPSE